jgi:hypothetical protein
MQMHFPMSYKTLTNYICFLYTGSFGLSIGFGWQAVSDHGAPRDNSFQQKTAITNKANRRLMGFRVPDERISVWALTQLTGSYSIVTGAVLRVSIWYARQ